MSDNISVAIAFAAGLLSFLSPCVLPLVPAYLGHLAGTSVHELDGATHRRAALSHAALFVLGFSVVFIVFWISIGLIGYLVQDYASLLRQGGGILLIIMGLHVSGLLRIPWLYQERRFQAGAGWKTGYLSSFGIGLLFAAGWTPCIGPILSGIIALASTRDTVAQGFYLLVAYSAGLGVPFLVVAAGLGSATRVLKRLNRYASAIELLSGIFLIAVGILMFTNTFARLPQYFNWGTI